MKGEVVQILSTATVVAGAKAGSTTEAGPGAVSMPTSFIVRVPAGALTVYFGGSQVTTETGTPFVAGEDLSGDLINEILYAVISSSTTSQTVFVLRRGD